MKTPERILELISKALNNQFGSGYSWYDMISDIPNLTQEEIEWAKDNIDYKAYIMGEVKL